MFISHIQWYLQYHFGQAKKPVCHDVHFIAYFKLVFDCFVVVLLFVLGCLFFLTKVSVTLSRGFKLSFHLADGHRSKSLHWEHFYTMVTV